MARYRCTVCNFVYDEAKEGRKFSDLPEGWRCPVCNAEKSAFILLSDSAKIAPESTTVSDVLIAQLAAWGVKYVFGIPGTSCLGVVDALRKNDEIRFIQVRHEQTAAFMASAYAKLTGNVAACLTVAGPGATNLATGLYDAKLDRAPVIALTGLVKRQSIGPGSFQEIDQHSFFEPICVFNKVLMSEDQTTTLATLAVKHALVERGVSHLSIPNDVQKIPYSAKILPMEGRIPNRAITPSPALMQAAADAIDASTRPVIISGFGALSQGEAVMRFARKITAPIVTTFRGKGVVDEYDEQYMGSHGTISSTSAAEVVRKSDLLIVAGASYSDMTQIPEKKTVQIDIDPMMLAKNHPVAVGLWGNTSEVLPALLAKVKERRDEDYREEMRTLKAAWLKQLEKESESRQKPLRPQYIISVLNQKLADDAVIALDIGENGWWFGRNFLMKTTQQLVMSGYLASMGAGLPGALAAKIAYPARQVACITGDGGFAMVMGDFMTAVKQELPVKLFLMNNRQLGMIMQEQKVEGYPNWQTELYNCDFARYAENCGGIGIRVEEPGELPAAVDKALSSKKPALVDIATDPRRFI
ncbi:MAG: thiamine pyrophosphate-binding protein [Candidatus Altiarchaeota archaeon]|nr:thiamine pyrophosphate-binding protein [Candidatus Altiarchaeota archaeon]